MQVENYTVKYNKKLQMLEFKHDFFYEDSISILEKLFENFGLSLANIIFERYSLPVSRFYYCNSDHTVSNMLFYVGDIQCDETITDILFLHGEYSDYKNHDPVFLSQAQFLFWQNALKEIDKPAILKALYQDNKISRAYLFKHAYSHPASLYELGKYNLFINNIFGSEAVQAEKINELMLPLSIKEDLKHSFSRS